MKIAIHQRLGSFSDRWIEYCKMHGIEYKIVNAYNSDIIRQVEDCDAFMWHHHQDDYRDKLFSIQLILSLEAKGVRCFPNSDTSWHFDDKVGQKYLLEAVGAPLVPSYVFYSPDDAFNWIKSTEFPKVFKLRGGAGSSNVKLVRNEFEARNLVRKAFKNGFSQYDKWGNLKERYRKWKEGKVQFVEVLKGAVRLFWTTKFARMRAPEKGYVYFQDFIPNNSFDIRIIVIGDKAFAMKRIVRNGDFRASGSGNFVFDRLEIPEECLKISFGVSKKLKAQCLAYDYVFGLDRSPSIVEISYGFVTNVYDSCPGYWTEDLHWHEEKFNPQGWMVETLINH